MWGPRSHINRLSHVAWSGGGGAQHRWGKASTMAECTEGKFRGRGQSRDDGSNKRNFEPRWPPNSTFQERPTGGRKWLSTRRYIFTGTPKDFLTSIKNFFFLEWGIQYSFQFFCDSIILWPFFWKKNLMIYMIGIEYLLVDLGSNAADYWVTSMWIEMWWRLQVYVSSWVGVTSYRSMHVWRRRWKCACSRLLSSVIERFSSRTNHGPC